MRRHTVIAAVASALAMAHPAAVAAQVVKTVLVARRHVYAGSAAALDVRQDAILPSAPLRRVGPTVRAVDNPRCRQRIIAVIRVHRQAKDDLLDVAHALRAFCRRFGLRKDWE